MKEKFYGKELILDLHCCDPETFNRRSIRKFLEQLCEHIIYMDREKLTWWDDYGVPKKYRETKPHLKGTSVVQFIKTSNITIHTLDLLKRVYINIFSCKDFNERHVTEFARIWFVSKKIKQVTVITRI